MPPTLISSPAPVVFRIERDELVDNYKAPALFDGLVWRPDGTDRRWPLFHPSGADPDGGYREHSYTLEFELEEVAGSYLLRLPYLTIAPRLAHLVVEVNGVPGEVHFRPRPSLAGEIRLHAGLHTSIYSEGEARLVVPGSLFVPGINRLRLTARDAGEVVRIEHPEAIKRLDRMADAAGFVYQGIELSESDGDVGDFIGAIVEPTVVYIRGADGQLRERVYLDLELSGATGGGELTLTMSDGSRSETHGIDIAATAFGHIRRELEIFDGNGPVHYELEGELDGREVRMAGEFRRRRKWKVFISPHAHTDIGYTHRQWEVAERLNRNIDVALDTLARQDEILGEPKSFAFHLDASWPLENWLATRTREMRQQLEARIRSGEVNVASNYADLLTQFAGLEDLIRNGEFSDSVLAPLGKRADLAAFVDVASLTGSLPTVLALSGVRYLIHADNQDRGPFRLNGRLHRRSPFWWQGTGGGKVLYWLAKMYCELRKVCGSPPGLDVAARGLDLWLQEYEGDEYAPDAVLLYGQEADNTDLDPQPVQFVRNWNEAVEYPKLIAADVSDFFRYVEEGFGDRLPTITGDGGAYWEDGVLSSLAQTIDVRYAQAALPAAERLDGLAVVHNRERRFPKDLYDDAWRELLLYVEHTWGAFLSCTEPDALLARDQWSVKHNMARHALEWSKRLLHGAATRHSLNWNNDGREVVVYNPHSWQVSGLVTVEIARGERAVSSNGGPVPSRTVHRGITQQLVELWIQDLPAFSYRRFRLEAAAEPTMPAGVEGQTSSFQGMELRASHGMEISASNGMALSASKMQVLESPWYRLTFDGGRGCVVSLVDLELNRELVDVSDRWGFGQLVYALGGEGTRLISNQSGLPEGNPELLADFELTDLRSSDDELGSRLMCQGTTACGTVEIEWSLPRLKKGVDLRFRLDKVERVAKEALYVAFPLAQPDDARVLSDSQLGWVDWDEGQLPGGCKEWLPLQTGILSSSRDMDVLIASPDIPLFCSGDIVRGRWPRELTLTGGRIFSYVLNNYWHTNYKASQGGPIEFAFSMLSSTRIEPGQAYREGWSKRLPAYAQRLSFQDFRRPRHPYDSAAEGNLATLEGNDVVITTIREARNGDGTIVRFQEIGGVNGSARLTFPGRRIAGARLTDLLEHDIREVNPEPDGGLTVELPAWGLTTVRLHFE